MTWLLVTTRPSGLMTKPLPPASERNSWPGAPWTGPSSSSAAAAGCCCGCCRRPRGPKKNSNGSVPPRPPRPPAGAFSMVAAWMETTAGSTASARSAKLGSVVVACCAASRVADSSGPVRRPGWGPSSAGLPRGPCRRRPRPAPAGTSPGSDYDWCSCRSYLLSRISSRNFLSHSHKANVLPGKFPRRAGWRWQRYAKLARLLGIRQEASGPVLGAVGQGNRAAERSQGTRHRPLLRPSRPAGGPPEPARCCSVAT